MSFDPLQKPKKARKWFCVCGHVTQNPIRWVIGAKTKFECDRCRREIKEIKSHSKLEWPLMSECVDRKDQE